MELILAVVIVLILLAVCARFLRGAAVAIIVALALLAVCGLAAWGTTTAATSLALAAGILANQVTIGLLAATLVAALALMVFVAVKAFRLGQATAERRAQVEIGEMNRAARQARAGAGSPLPYSGQVVVLQLPEPQPTSPRAAPRSRRRVRRASRAARQALAVARRWFT